MARTSETTTRVSSCLHSYHTNAVPTRIQTWHINVQRYALRSSLLVLLSRSAFRTSKLHFYELTQSTSQPTTFFMPLSLISLRLLSLFFMYFLLCCFYCGFYVCLHVCISCKYQPASVCVAHVYVYLETKVQPQRWVSFIPQ